MLSEDVLQQRWLQLKSSMAGRLGDDPCMDSILVFIGVREAGLPSKVFTEKEKTELRQMAIYTILTPGGYYELLWVDDTGWPHYNQRQSIRDMSVADMEHFLKEYVLAYAEKNKLL